VTGAEIATLAQILAPIAKEIIVEGIKITATFKADLTEEQMLQSLELSKSASWPQLDFKPEAV